MSNAVKDCRSHTSKCLHCIQLEKGVCGGSNATRLYKSMNSEWYVIAFGRLSYGKNTHAVNLKSNENITRTHFHICSQFPPGKTRPRPISNATATNVSGVTQIRMNYIALDTFYRLSKKFINMHSLGCSWNVLHEDALSISKPLSVIILMPATFPASSRFPQNSMVVANARSPTKAAKSCHDNCVS